MQFPDLEVLNSRLQTVLDEAYGGVESKMMDDLGEWSQSTLNRALRLSTQITQQTLTRHNRRIASELVDAGIIRREFIETGERPIQPKEVNDRLVSYESGGDSGVSLPRVSFRASAGDGNFVTEKEVADHYVVDKRELRATGAPNGLFVVEVDGESMKPEFRPGEWLIMQSVQPDQLIRVDGVYLYRHEDMVQLKRLQRRGGRTLHVLPANDRYPDYTITIDDATDFELLGSVYARFERYS